MYKEEDSVFRTTEMQTLKQNGTIIDEERPVDNLFSVTEKGFCILQTARPAQEMQPGGSTD